MSDTSTDDSIGPRAEPAAVTLPPAVGERLGRLLGAGDRLDTAADWVAATRAAADRAGRRPGIEDLCTTPDGRHSFEPATGGGTRAFVCVLDPLLVPFLRDTPGTVRSEPPAGGPVTVEITPRDATATPPDVVVSLGVADEVAAGDPGRLYEAVCPYVHAFDSRASYESWAAGTDGHATAVPVEQGIAVARELAAVLFDGDG
jgi:hypothetical protein